MIELFEDFACLFLISRFRVLITEKGYGHGKGLNSDSLFKRFQRLAAISHPVVTVGETQAVSGPVVRIDLHRLAALPQSLWIVFWSIEVESSNVEQLAHIDVVHRKHRIE